MKLITKQLVEELKIPALYETSELSSEDVQVMLKLFDIRGSWSWYIIEFDIDSNMAFGFTDGEFQELGYVPIDELESLESQGIPRIERDLYFKQISLAELKKQIKKAY